MDCGWALKFGDNRVVVTDIYHYYRLKNYSTYLVIKIDTSDSRKTKDKRIFQFDMRDDLYPDYLLREAQQRQLHSRYFCLLLKPYLRLPLRTHFNLIKKLLPLRGFGCRSGNLILLTLVYRRALICTFPYRSLAPFRFGSVNNMVRYFYCVGEFDISTDYY